MPEFRAEQWFGFLNGEDVIVCGLGPSIETVVASSLWRRWWAIGVNDVNRYIDTDFLLCVDDANRLNKRLPAMRDTTAKVLFYMDDSIPEAIHHPVCAKLDIVQSAAGPEDRYGICGLESDTSIPAWQHSPHVAAALAFRMGAKRVGFLGVDLQGGKHHSTHSNKPSILAGMRNLMRYAGKRGCEFYTLTDKSALAEIMPVRSVTDFDVKRMLQ